ncbi:MAG: hypothetical protein A2845_00110 [Candidatus Lloydbacteria bacterium RIFCSPHIGHO2_01_FULL_49_22]|uniref:Dipeptidylpeptidase IV N-terminal domain-containing protein n=1 Tax=Candidatus Lloydbacteria bacterium RIFCSPHIGHO2_01_FULL_49_22 TaxID=1798658 RepID=A0A1G2CZV6_9BACT|nr:MAG: hypothetical protein A2845_00110 [Candidatus Lloydbacteria bacterium RIFCSPHIGHO2_01_FULL_49_22]OGZ09271.1 MAG: hypothetical protein A3C14_05015 [Candidatus Lloydbacteria bacterium RIFCSPHIGHO2_02_FULL_50_18]
MEQEEQRKRWWIWIVAGIVVVLLVILVLLLTLGKDTSIARKVGAVLPFGQVLPETPVSDIIGDITPTGSEETPVITGEEPVFRQLSKESVAGFTTVIRDGITYVRYVLRENGNIHEVDPSTGTDRQITNTTIPRVYEAFFGNNGNTIIMRYLKRVLNNDVIVTYLGNLELPTNEESMGSIRSSTEFLPDNISAVSISPDGTRLFYLLPVSDGVSGTLISLNATLFPKEVFRNSFSEWLPQLFDDGTILLTTKPSAGIAGYSYLYDPIKKTLTRIVREKNGLTTFGDSVGSRILFGENVANAPFLGMYTKKSFSSHEGVENHEALIPLATLPEKCAWGVLPSTLYCGSFVGSTGTKLPDEWYQGLISLSDTFWMVNTDTTEITFIADPESVIQKHFDVIMPLIDKSGRHFIFVNKEDDSLWSMRLPKPTGDLGSMNVSETLPPLTPEEQKDAAGSIR